MYSKPDDPLPFPFFPALNVDTMPGATAAILAS